MYQQSRFAIAFAATVSVSGVAHAQTAPPAPPVPPAPVAPVAPAPPAAPVHSVRKPDGYLGITFSGEPRVQRMHGKTHISFPQYPAIVAVDAGSPAARGGLTAGDTILQFNHHDVRRPIALYEMLRPGARFHVRVRRNGDSRNVNLTVERNPRSAYQYRNVARDRGDISEEVRREVERAQAEARREIEEARGLSDRERAEITRELQRAETELRRTVTIPPIAFSSNLMSGVAGAHVTTMNDDLAELTGTRAGVFVVSVPPNTPAARTGLRGGDVIVSVGDSAIADLSDLRRAIQAEQRRVRREGGERETRVEVVRRQRKHRLTLRW